MRQCNFIGVPEDFSQSFTNHLYGQEFHHFETKVKWQVKDDVPGKK
jgi:hypothetical protein